MDLIELYKNKIKEKDYAFDENQLKVVSALNELALVLNNPKNSPRRSFLDVLTRKSHRIKAQKGIYIWGSVGRGKTFLMDLFFESLRSPYKERIHFNHFMKMVHKRLSAFKGQRSPLDKLADELIAKMHIICFDEFFVEDIADAMILGNLFSKLFDRGITFVATSNVEPSNLYLGGLQRELFLPAIDKLLAHVDVYNLDSGVDYRWSQMIESKRYFEGLAKESQLEKMNDIFTRLCQGDYIEAQSLLLEGREIDAVKLSTEVAWFEFESLCGYGRGVHDYIEMAAKYKPVLLSNIPVLTDDLNDETRRFIALVDEFYDSKVLLYISAEVAIKELYQGKQLAFEFQRTISRLHEMQSKDYLDQSINFDKSSRHALKASS